MSSLIRRARSIVIAVGLAVLVTVLTPVWFVHDRATRAITRLRTGRTTTIPRQSAHATDVDRVLRGHRPVIVEGLAPALGIGDAATPAGLRARAGDHSFELAVHDDAAPYFLYSGGYGATEHHRRKMTVSDLLDMMFGDGPEPGTTVYQLLGIRAADGRIAEELDEFDRAITAACDHTTEPRFSGVWIGSVGVVTPLHHDAWPGLLFQTWGRKRVAMYAPTDRSNLSFRTPLVGAGRWSDLPARSAEADPASFPRLRHAIRLEGELGPGDALYIPPFWAHEMEAVEPNISVPFRFATFRTSYLNPGFLRPASELVRARLAR